MFWKRKPKLFAPECYTLGWAHVMQWAGQFVDTQHRFINRSQTYLVPVNPAYVMRSIPSYEHEYIPGKRECEAFVYIFRAELAKLAYGNMLAMDVSVTLVNGDHHALIGYKMQDNLVLGDPQTGRIVQPEIQKVNFIIA